MLTATATLDNAARIKLAIDTARTLPTEYPELFDAMMGYRTLEAGMNGHGYFSFAIRNGDAISQCLMTGGIVKVEPVKSMNGDTLWYDVITPSFTRQCYSIFTAMHAVETAGASLDGWYIYHPSKTDIKMQDLEKIATSMIKVADKASSVEPASPMADDSAVSDADLDLEAEEPSDADLDLIGDAIGEEIDPDLEPWNDPIQVADDLEYMRTMSAAYDARHAK